MYIITYRHHQDNIECLVKDSIGLSAVTSLLENAKIYYTVSASWGFLKQEHFGWGGHKFWRERLYSDYEIAELKKIENNIDA